MKISCTQENLIKGLIATSHIANKNSNLPILSNILFKSKDKVLSLSSTNLEIGVTTQIRSKIEQDGEFTIDAKLLTDYISLLPKDRIDLELIDNELKIKCLKQKTKIKTQPTSDFPLIPKIEKEKLFILSAEDFKNSISEIIFSVSTSETRPEISGVFMSFNEEKLILAATDSYRLTEKKLKLLEKPKNNKDVIIPVRTLQEISRILGLFKDDGVNEGDNIEIYLTDNQIMFSYNGIELISRLIEGQYPDYTQIIPTSFKTEVIVDLNSLIKAVKTSSLFTKSGVYDIKLDFEDNQITITSSSAQTGENISNIEAKLSGEKNSITLNHRYLLDGLVNIKSNNVIFKLNDSNSPCLIKSENDNNYLYIIMPIKQ